MREINLQMFNMLGLLSKGTTLTYQANGEWQEIGAIRSTPQLGGSPETVDVTHLQSERMQNITGLQSTDNLEFTVVYQQNNFQTVALLERSGEIYNWRVNFPDGLYGEFSGQVSLNMAGAEVNSALEFLIIIVVSEGPFLHYDEVLSSKRQQYEKIITNAKKDVKKELGESKNG